VVAGDAWRLDFNLTGGELLSHPDWREFLRRLREALPASRIALLLSGELLTDPVADELGSEPLRYVQFSLDGGRKAHEQIRGPGSFETVLSAIRRMSLRDVDVVVSHTAFPGRTGALADAAKAARAAGARSIWTDRVVPGPGQPGWDEANTQGFLDELAECSKKLSRGRFRVRTSRALQFLSCGGEPYSCTAGEGLLSVLADGTLVPCRRLPVAMGMLPDDDPLELWHDHVFTARLRTRAPEGCTHCLFRNSCRGGAPCLTFAQTGEPFLADPACPAPAWVRRG